ncbi:prepilin-type N-terminal cleavage/methylation domain-containing protein [Candidatus Microgenomates bacterium]|nr:prepilin-type N-terminal cleavage/methylation domain-containing protein [Candidatus Microgenomates bacterium]
MNKSKYQIGFTLIEILVVISIIGILIALSVFGLTGARESSRDAKRKSDLQEIRAGLELYKSDCDVYPDSLPSGGDSLKGTEVSGSCTTTNIYISTIPADTNADRVYYYSSDGTTYTLCAALESGGTAGSCGSSSCGSVTCNYKTTNP